MRGTIRTGLVAAVVVWVLLAGGAVLAEKTTVEIRSGTVLAVDGNLVVIKGPEGVREFDVADDFVFNMGEKKLSVHELKPGMTISAVITTVEKPVQMTATEVRSAEVIHTTGESIVIRNQDGELKKFTAKELKDREIVINRGGERVSPYDLREGDRVTATVVTELPPETITESELNVFVRQNRDRPRRVARTQPRRTTPPPRSGPRRALPKTGSPIPLIGLAGLVSLGLGLGLTAVRRLRH